jgi:hypothetical protein
VAVSGDTLVVGAPGEDSNATGVNGDQSDNNALFAGAAYVFARSAGVWSQEAYLKASNAEAGDYFGYSVAASGSVLAIGARTEDSAATGVNGNEGSNGALDSGAAYVFVKNGGAWSQQAYLKASNSGSSDKFASALAISGDVVLAGAFDEQSNATGVNGNQADNSLVFAGAAYAFDLDNQPGTSSYGTGTPGCSGAHALDVTHAPMLGSPHFALTCDNAPPSSLGLGIVTNAQDLNGSDPFGLGALLHVNLFAATEVYSVDFLSDAVGNARSADLAIALNPALVGTTYYAMALWVWTSCALPPFNLSTSRGLALTLLWP